MQQGAAATVDKSRSKSGAGCFAWRGEQPCLHPLHQGMPVPQPPRAWREAVPAAAWHPMCFFLCVRLQAYAWDFDVFDFGEKTQGNPLVSMTIALLELHNLMVSASCAGAPGHNQQDRKQEQEQQQRQQQQQ